MITINGQFTARQVTGQERFAYEMLTELDMICSKGQYELVVPKNAFNIPIMKNIPVIEYGKAKGALWEQTFFAWYMIKHPNNVSLNLLTIMPILKPGIICIHDMQYRVCKEYWNTIYKKISMYWHLFQEELARRFSPLIFTVSEYSKIQMMENLHLPSERIFVLGNGWDHFKRVVADTSLSVRCKDLFDKPYFYTLGSLAQNKNIKWVLEVAQKHPQYNFLIGGKADLRAYGSDYKDEDFANVKFLGYMTDGEVKYLMSCCRAFIFPSLYEGFGIPPLEAMSVGAKCIIAKSSCLPEIFGDAVYWIDPHNSDVNLDEIMQLKITDSQPILEKYLFSRFANMMHNKILQMDISK